MADSDTFKSIDVDQLFNDGTIIVFKCDLSEEYPLSFVSANVEKILGIQPVEFYQDESAWTSHIHPADKEKVNLGFKRVMEDGSPVINEYRFINGDGQQIWLRDEIKLQYVDGKAVSIMGTSFDITARKESELESQKEIEAELRTRLNFQHALAKCSSMLIDSTDEDVLNNVLSILLEVTNADRAYMFTNSVSEEGKLLVSQQFEVKNSDVQAQLPNPELQNVPYENFPYFHQTLSDNKLVFAISEELPSPEKELMLSQGIESALLLPIFVGEDWFGFIGFDLLNEKRKWDPKEIEVLRTVVEIIGSYLKRISMERTLLQQKDFTQQILDNIPGILVILDKKMNILQWNEKGERFTGYTGKELSEKRAFDIISNEDHSLLKKAMRNIIQKKSEGQELSLRHKRGHLSPYFWRGSIIKMDGEQVFLNIGMNISKQKEMENALIKEKELAEAIVQSIPGTFFILDEEFKFIRINKNLADLLGYEEKDILQKSPTAFYAKEYHERIKSNLQLVLDNGKASMFSNPRNKDGKELARKINFIRFDQDGESFIMGAGQDISDLKQHQNDLEASVHEKQVLLQEIHHRVKNNLAVISGLLELQKNEYQEAKFQRLINESQLRIQTMAMIHEKLYQSDNLSRISILQYIDDLIDQIKQSFQTEVTSISVYTDIEDIELNINQAIPFALALNEILSNAYEHAFNGRDKGVIRVMLKSEGNDIISLIEDDGRGIDELKDKDLNPSLGMTLINALLAQIEATWNMESNDGVKYHIQFSKDREKGPSSDLL